MPVTNSLTLSSRVTGLHAGGLNSKHLSFAVSLRLSLIGRGRWRDKARGKGHSRILCASDFSSSCCTCPHDYGYGPHPVMLGPSCGPRANDPSVSSEPQPGDRLALALLTWTPHTILPASHSQCPDSPRMSTQSRSAFSPRGVSCSPSFIVVPRSTGPESSVFCGPAPATSGLSLHPAGCGEALTFSREVGIPFGELCAQDAGHC